MNDFDTKLKKMAMAEACSAPEGFEERLAEQLAGLPEKKRRSRRVKWALTAACLCMALVGTAAAGYIAGNFRAISGELHVSGTNGNFDDYSGVTLWGGTVRFIPVDSISEEARAMAGDKLPNSVSKKFSSWAEAEEFYNVTFPVNPMVEDLSVTGTLTFDAEKPTVLDLFSDAVNRNNGTELRVFAQLYTEQMAVYYSADEMFLSPAFPSEYEFTVEEYTAQSGMTAQLSHAWYTGDEDTAFFPWKDGCYQAYFILDGVRYSVEAVYSEGSESLALEWLQQVLEAFEA